MKWTTQLYELGQILAAMILGGLIGYERETANKPAGWRTYMLVGGATCLLVILGYQITPYFDQGPSHGNINADPIRIIQAIIIGISFLGAGTIIRRQEQRDEQQQVHGLTSSATILFATGVGIAVGLTQYVLAVSSTLLILLINRILGWVEDRFIEKD
jgi:putative Mg2+ transporter-C (MgtC) family protein